MRRKRERFSFFTNVACRNIPSDGFDLADEICEFFVTCFWQQDTENRNHDADYSENNKWQNPTVSPRKEGKSHLFGLVGDKEVPYKKNHAASWI